MMAKDCICGPKTRPVLMANDSICGQKTRSNLMANDSYVDTRQCLFRGQKAV